MPSMSTDEFLHKVHEGDRDAVIAHLTAGGDINATNDGGYSPLLVAIDGRHPELAAELLDRGADVKQALNGGFSALHLLIEQIRNRPLNYSVTVQRGRKRVTLTDPDEIRAEIGSHPDDEFQAWLSLARKLVERGVDVEAAKHASGQRALRDAAEVSSDLVALLLESCHPDVNAIDHEGYTPLHLAARSGDPRTVELLLAAGATLDAAENYGFTPLHEAIVHGQPELARQLLAAGADPNKQLVRDYEKFEAGDDAYAIAKKCKLRAVFDDAPASANKPRKGRKRK